MFSFLNFGSSSKSMSNQPETPFGNPFREKYFTNLDSSVIPINHGSYGLTPTPIHEKYLENITRNANYPDKFMKFEQKEYYIESLKLLSQVLNCDYHDLAIVDNATTGANTILRSYPFKKGDLIVILNTIYGACGNTVKFLKDRYGVDFIVIDVNYPTTDEEILSKFENVFKEKQPTLCIFDTITSMPGIIFPFKQMTKLCKSYNVISLIDGAHGIGCISQDLKSLDPDFYVSNLHKWFFLPFGCAVLYVNQKYHNKIHTLPISHSYISDDTKLSKKDQENRLIDRFFFNGTKNFASIQTIPYAIKFRQEVCGGESTIYNYCNSLAKNVAKMVSEKWGSAIVLKPIATTMVTIVIPNEYPEFIKNWSEYDNLVYEKMFAAKAYTPIASHNNQLIARFSCQIYNELKDYEIASDVLIKSLEEVAKEQGLKKK
ncbi:unnamed protein product [Candida verbasci]|uniref:Aminotransferase class V domain-containing protein n=1 Tax=Candida verbasci TaxID=1227364 RepID=A0A9W4TXV1_9ASCO|nr:unnamed protein product [Candida verbasci]